MIRTFSGATADEVWRQAIDVLRHDDACTLQQSRLGDMREVLHATFEIKNPRERWVYSRLPAINPAFAIAEVFWILSGSNNANLINFWNPLLPKFVGQSSRYHGAYGYRIKNRFGIDQLERCFLTLKNNPNSRQAVIQIWDPKIDLPEPSGLPVSNDIPCNLCSMLKVRNGKLEWMQVMRSNDLYRGTPYNIVQFTMLQEILAGWLGLEVGGYYQISDSLHIYERDFHELSSRNQPYNITNVDNISVNKQDYDQIFKNVWQNMKALTKTELNSRMFYKIVDSNDIPESYRNLLLTVAADSARRRKMFSEMNWAMEKCSNPSLVSLLKEWFARWKSL